MATRDYFAELYVAGLMADAGWNVYFPHRDRGMDFFISKTGPDDIEIIRPVQVNGKYPEEGKKDFPVYGYVGKLNQIHPQMVLAIPYFATASLSPPTLVAYMPFSKIKVHSRGYRSQPARFKNGVPIARRDHQIYFDEVGLKQIELTTWA